MTECVESPKEGNVTPPWVTSIMVSLLGFNNYRFSFAHFSRLHILHIHVVALQAVGPVALVSLLLSEGLTKVIPGAELNVNPNQPADPQMQQKYNHAAIQVSI